MKENVGDPSLFITLNQSKVISWVYKNVFKMLTVQKFINAPLAGQAFGETSPAKM